MKSREGINMTQNNAHPRAEEINRIAELLIAEWERCEPQEGKVNPSRIANFADMARVVVEDYDGCPVHAGQIHGDEAQELRHGIEKIMVEWRDGDEHHDIWIHAVRALLDEVDARDSLAYAELRKSLGDAARDQLRKEQRISIEHIDPSVGQWRPCTGCHELNEGHPTGSWSGVFRCNLGNGCRECGGIGAVWEQNPDDEKLWEQHRDDEKLGESAVVSSDRLDEIRQLDENDSPADLSIAVAELFDDVTATHRELELAKGEISRMTMRPADEVLDAARAYAAKLDVIATERNRLLELVPKCSGCGKPASCLGNYDQSCGGEAGTSAEDDYACDECCGHGNEDGHCWPLADIAGVVQTLDVNLTEVVAENKKLEVQVVELKARILNGPTESGDLAERIRAELKAQLAAVQAELAAFKDAVSRETIAAASKR